MRGWKDCPETGGKSRRKREVVVSTLLQGHVGRGDRGASGMAMRMRWSPACASTSDTLLPDALCPRPYPGQSPPLLRRARYESTVTLWLVQTLVTPETVDTVNDQQRKWGYDLHSLPAPAWRVTSPQASDASSAQLWLD